MAQIRDTIELLTRVLRDNGTFKMKAEYFRLAKFGNDDAVEAFWRLLFELVYYLKYASIDEVSVRAFGELTKEEIVVFVKREMQQRGFFSRDFAHLPTDMSCGSRDLLLAFGWLMCKEGIIDKFMDNCASPLDNEMSSLEAFGIEPDEEAAAFANLSPRSQADPVTKVKQLLWLNGKLRLSLRSLYSLQREQAKLMHKLNESTSGVSLDPSRNHLSQLEVYMLRHPELLKKNLQLLEKDNERLQNLLYWKEKEDIFWKWMESVLDAKVAAVTGRFDEEDAAPNNLTMQVSRENVEKLKAAHDRLEQAINKYESIVGYVEKSWAEKKNDVSATDLDNLLQSIDLEISVQKANIALSDGGDNFLQQQVNPTFTYRRSPPGKLSRETQTGGLAARPLEEIADIKDEINMLGELVHRLQDEINDKQSEYKNDMQVLSEKFNDVVCIPPMTMKEMTTTDSE